MKHLAYLIALSVAACSKAEPPRAAVEPPVAVAPTNAPAVAPTVAPTPPPAPLSTANTFTTLEEEVVHWDVNGRRLEVTMNRVELGTAIHVTGGGAAFDFKVAAGDILELAVIADALVYRSMPSSEEPLDTYSATRFAWATDKPVIENTWTCSRKKRSDRCKFPAWADEPTDAATAPNEADAIQLTRDWLVELGEVSHTRDPGTWFGENVTLAVADCPPGAAPRAKALLCAQTSIAWVSSVIATSGTTTSSVDGAERVVRWALEAGAVRPLETPLVVELAVGLENAKPVIRAMRVTTS